jgi:hypothetical protein
VSGEIISQIIHIGSVQNTTYINYDKQGKLCAKQTSPRGDSKAGIQA